MRKFDNGKVWNDTRLNLFGVNDMKGVIPEGTSTLHFMLWKHILINLTLNSIQGTPIDPLAIIDRACIRLYKRIKSIFFEIQAHKCTCEATERQPNFHRFARRVEGIGTVDDTGRVHIHEDLQAILDINSNSS